MLAEIIGSMGLGRFRDVIETYDTAGFDTAGVGPIAEASFLAGMLCAEACAVTGEQERASELAENTLALQGGIHSEALVDRALTAWCRVLFLAGNWETCRQILQSERRQRPSQMLPGNGELEALEAVLSGGAGDPVVPLPLPGSKLEPIGAFIFAAAEAVSSPGMGPPAESAVHRVLLDQSGIAGENGPQLYAAGSAVLHSMVIGDVGVDGFFGVPATDLKHLLRVAKANDGHLGARYGVLASGLLNNDAGALVEAARLGSTSGDRLLARKAGAAAASLAGTGQDRKTMRQARITGGTRLAGGFSCKSRSSFPVPTVGARCYATGS